MPGKWKPQKNYPKYYQSTIWEKPNSHLISITFIVQIEKSEFLKKEKEEKKEEKKKKKKGNFS